VLVVAIVPLAARQAAPAFEAASVKVNTSGDAASRFGFAGPGRLTVTNNSLRNIVRNVWNVQNFQIVGGPAWLDSMRFDIAAVAPADAPAPDVNAMMKTLLADRFKLVAHTETRDMPAYALIVREPGRLGPELKPVAVDCGIAERELRAAGRPLPADRPLCGLRTRPGDMQGASVSMPQFARNLSGVAGRSVVDATSLAGVFDLRLTWAPDQTEVGVSADAPSLVTAVQEQLGLKLESRRMPIEVVVIDRAELPSAD
jgi:uncharacterized protein (TIGR03435 family)